MSTIQATNLKHNASASNNIVLDSSGNATFAGTAAMASSFLRNRIINGDMRLNQRGSGSVSGNNVFPVDRFTTGASQTGKFTVAQDSATPPSGFTNYIRVTSSSAYTLLSTDEFEMIQKIEGNNVADLDFGLSTARSVTLSFWVRSSLTGTFAVSFYNNATNRSYAATYVISAANTWEQKAITLPGDTTGTWLKNNSDGLNILWSLGAGSSVIGSAGSWQGTFLRGVTGQTNLVATNGATWDLTGVQLEVGSAATPFERRQFGQELALCQRYCFVLNQNGVATGVWGGLYSSTAGRMWTKLPVTMRANPSLSNTSNTNTFEMLSVAITSGTLTNFASSRDYITFDAVSLGVSSVIGLPLCYIGPGTISAEL